MKWWVLSSSLITLLFSCLSLAEDIGTSLRLEADKVLPQIRKELASKSLSNDKRYSLSILLARELMAAEYYTEAQKFYEEAIKLKSTHPTPEPYINVAFIKQQSNSLSKDEATQIAATLKKNPEWKEIAQEFEELYLVDKTKPRSKPYQGYFGAYKNDVSIRALIGEKEYAQALTFIGNINSKHDILSKITFDLLSTIVKGQQKTLLCEDVLKKYPASLSYSMLLCRMLIQKRKKLTISEIDYKKLNEQIKRESPDKLYLEQLARELK